MRRLPVAAALLLLVGLAACNNRNRVAVPTATAPKYPQLQQPDVPQGLSVAPVLRERYDAAWLRLQAGDMRAATRELSEILKQAPEFYPAEVALGDVALADKQFKDALAWFSAAAAKDENYLPAAEGRVDAALGAADDLELATALEQLLRIDPSREAARTRLDLIRLRIVEQQLSAGTKARAAGRLDEAQAIFERALPASPDSAVLLRELAAVEMDRGALDAAEQHASRAVEADRGDADALAILGSILEMEGKTAAAVDAFDRAVRLDGRPVWLEKRDALRTKASLEALPAEYRGIPSAPSITRAQVAAMIGLDLQPIVSQAPRKAALVVTDVRTHWAASWILPVVQAGIMDAYSNHTFQPNTMVRRSDLAQIVAQMINVVALKRADEVARWRAARPRLEDVPVDHASYRAIALSVAAGAMALDDTGRFVPARAASGAELVRAVNRIKQLEK